MGLVILAGLLPQHREAASMGLPVPSPPSVDPVVRRATAGDRAARVRYRRALLVVSGVVGLGLATLHHQYVFWLVSDTGALGCLRIGLMGLAVGWALLFLDAWRIGQPLSLTLGHRRAVVGLNGVLCFSVAGALLFSA